MANVEMETDNTKLNRQNLMQIYNKRYVKHSGRNMWSKLKYYAVDKKNSMHKHK